MGRLATEDRSGKYELQQVQDLHREIARLVIVGHSNIKIADTLNVSPACVSYTRNSTLVKGEIARLQGERDSNAVDIGGELQALAPLAKDILEECMSNPEIPMHTKLRAAADVLDRSGHPKQSMIKGHIAHALLTIEDIQDMQKRATECGRRAGIVVTETEVVPAITAPVGEEV